MGIGAKIERNVQLQEFVEKMLGYMFDTVKFDPLFVEEVCEDMDITEEELYWLFEQLGYTKEEE